MKWYVYGSLGLAIPMMAISQCGTDTDVDDDGWNDCGESGAGNCDCDDSDPNINPDAEEVEGDGVDNDCDGLIDEFFQDYSITFLEAGSGNPIPNVAVWLGLDGTGAAAFSDEEGRVVFSLENNVITWSFGHAYTDGGTEHRIVRTFNDDAIELENTVYLIDPTLDDRDVVQTTGTLSGLDPRTQPSQAQAYLISDCCVTGVEQDVSAPTMDFDLSLRAGSLLYAAQALEEPGQDATLTIPYSYAILPEPGLDESVELTGYFDQYAPFELIDLDSRMSNSFNELSIHFPNGAPDLNLHAYSYLVTSENAFGIRTALLEGALEGATYSVWAYYENPDAYISQFGLISGIVDPNGTLIYALPRVHNVDSYVALNAATLPGDSLNFEDDDEGDFEFASFVEMRTYGDAGIATKSSWTASQTDMSKEVGFAAIPDGLFDWPVSADLEGTYTTDSISAVSVVTYGYLDDDGAFTGSGVALRVDDPSARDTAPRLSMSLRPPEVGPQRRIVEPHLR